jgi:hypothetical protein
LPPDDAYVRRRHEEAPLRFHPTLISDKMSMLSEVRMINKDTMNTLRAEDTDKLHCIRISLTAAEEEMEQGVAAIARVVRTAFEHQSFAER